MNFEYLKTETECDCLKDTFEDNVNVYARKVGKGATPKDRDFRSHWERGKRPDNLKDCDSVCSLMGLSVHPWNKDTKSTVQDHYTESCRIAPGHKKKICVFKLAPDSGVFKHTPLTDDQIHHDLYKSDDFKVESILLENMIAIN